MGKHEVGRAEEQMSARKGRGSRWDVPCDQWKVGAAFGSLTGEQGKNTDSEVCNTSEAFLC